jgi:hypothetical protein
MHRMAFGLIGLLALAPALWGDDPPQDKAKGATEEKKPATPAEQYRALVEEFSKARQDFIKEYQGAKTPEDKSKILREKQPQPAKYAGKMMELAEKNPKDPVAISALMWVIQQVRTGAEFDKALDMLREHGDNNVIANACQAVVYSASPKAEVFLRTVMEKNPDQSVQAGAAYSLTQHLLTRARNARANPEEQQKLGEAAEKVFEQAFAKDPESKQLLAMAQQLGSMDSPVAAKLLRQLLDKSKQHEVQAFACFGLAGNLKKQSEAAKEKAKGEELSKEAEVLYERISKDFADVRRYNSSLADLAKGALNEIRFLGIGKVAPDIAADDIDGKPFKLSDYRGKVVMLDFWGNW